MMVARIHPESVLGRLRRMPDPRGRQGRVYPLAVILGMLLAGALEGEGSLRGMWMRGKHYWRELVERLGVLGVPEPPGLTTVWYVVQKVNPEKLEEALEEWVRKGQETVGMDGKVLRGSKRKGAKALQVLAMAGQGGGQILAEIEVEEGGEMAAALKLLSEVPLEGRVVSMDAGLMQRPVVKKVMEKGGTTSGS